VSAGLEKIRQAMADYLNSHGVEALTAWPMEPRRERDVPVVVVSLRGCKAGPSGFQDYLGERYNEDTGQWEDYRRLVQPSGTDGVARMEEQIRRFGCGEPVYVWSRRLLVDFERYATFHRLGIPFRIKNCSARNGEEVIDWICRNQLQRTDLSDAMRRYLIGRQYLSLKLLGK